MATVLRLPERNYLFEAQADQFLKVTHSPEDLRGVVWSKPPPGAVPILCKKIVLRRDKRKDGDFAPCPICSGSSPKYLEGALAWFEDEGVYRCIGKECIKTLCGEEKAEQVRRDFDYKQELDRDYEYAFNNVEAAPAIRDYFSALLNSVEHAEYLRSALAKAKIRHVLWQLSKVNDGMLTAWEVRYVEQFDRKTNSIEDRAMRVPIRYGAITGHAAFKGEFHHRAKVTGVINNVGHFCVPDAQNRVIDAYNDHQVLRSFRRAFSEAVIAKRRAINDIRSVLAFFDEKNFERIHKYGQDHRTHENLFARVTGNLYKIGPTMTDAVTVRPDFAILDGLPVWPLAE